MFLENESTENIDEYVKRLKIIGQLSQLFSDSNTPYLYYRIAEKIFCSSFKANDLSRSDVSADASKNNLGIGLKTFLAGNNKTFQKVAEFNRDKLLYAHLNPRDIPKKIAELRNSRIALTSSLFDLNNSIYHSVVRKDGLFEIHEESMDLIDIEKIKITEIKDSSVIFNDDKNDYSFLISKSTLTKRFVTTTPLLTFDILMLDNPLDVLEECFSKKMNLDFKTNNHPFIYLPLYGRGKVVFERSGLNQWNANGRERDPNEIYIPIPSDIHKLFPNFFPDRDSPFNLILPNKDILKSKVCQDNSKALMSYSNKELGKWLLRKVLKLKEGELLTYSKLQIIGVDSVRIDKISINEYEINFASCGTYEEFLNRFRNED